MSEEEEDVPFEERVQILKIDTSSFQKSNDFVEEVNRLKTLNKNKTKRKNSEPPELSAKLQVSRKRNVIHTQPQVRRDPRFDSLSGEFHETEFRKAYNFLDEIKEKEAKQLQSELDEQIDPVQQEKIQKALNNLSEQKKNSYR